MHRARHPVLPVLGAVARGDSHVCGVRAACERMQADIHAPTAKVKANGFRQLPAKSLLGLQVPAVPAPQRLGDGAQRRGQPFARRRRRRAALLPRRDVAEQCGHALAHGREDLAEARGGHAPLEVVDVRVVGAELGAHGPRHLRLQGHQVPEEGREGGEVARGLGRRPPRVRPGLQLRLPRRHLLGLARLLTVGPLRVAHVGRLVGRQPRAPQVHPFERGQQAPQRGLDLLLVQHARQRRLHLRPRPGAARRHHGHLIPAQETLNTTESLYVFQLFAKLVI
mmetsp:Transcript_27831/g.48318  ORF Transcript_27831/g.48318 Transcript_27831/m.48318 type:complete len:281 (-) Transcript_27831:230-1072(-)